MPTYTSVWPVARTRHSLYNKELSCEDGSQSVDDGDRSVSEQQTLLMSQVMLLFKHKALRLKA